VEIRESSFLHSLQAPRRLLEQDVHVHVHDGSAEQQQPSQLPSQQPQPQQPAASTPPTPIIGLMHGSSEVQIRSALSAVAEAPLLTFSSTEGVFGGWVDAAAHGQFEMMMSRSALLGGSWCCSSWYKPSGSINFARPQRTQLLPPGCGIPSAPASSAPGQPRPSLATSGMTTQGKSSPAESSQGERASPGEQLATKLCKDAHAARRQVQRPLPFVYERDKGPDGYWVLVGQNF